MQASHSPIINVAVSAARKAGDVIVRALDRLDNINITAKGRNDFATDIDHQAESIIIEILQKAYPDYQVISEECGKIESTSPYTWVIDPLDGTTNFIHGFPHFCISIALMHNQQVEHGVIYDPIRQELFTTTRGRGAQLNGRRIRVSERTNLRGALLSLSLTKHPGDEEAINHLRKILQHEVAGMRRSGSSCLDLAYVAAGRLDGFCEWGLSIWDLAAGILLVTEAGGMLAEPDGGDHYLDSGCIVAANPKLLTPFIKALTFK